MDGFAAGVQSIASGLGLSNEQGMALVQAVLAIEDRRFFEHGGVNYFSMISWAWHDVIGDRKHRGGASTLTMQLAKLLFLADTGTIKYKLTQIMVAFHLEHRFAAAVADADVNRTMLVAVKEK